MDIETGFIKLTPVGVDLKIPKFAAALQFATIVSCLVGVVGQLPLPHVCVFNKVEANVK